MSLLGRITCATEFQQTSKRTVERIRYTVWVDSPQNLPPVRAAPDAESFPENQLWILVVEIAAWPYEATLFLLRGVARMVGDEQRRRRVM
jgi:hypothetical protein